MTELDVKAPAYQWYARDFASDELVQLMTLEEEGAYRRLLDHQWLHGSIPADVAQLARICKNTPLRRMRTLWTAIAPCFVPVDGDAARLQNRRLERERAKSQEYRAQQSEKGKAGARARWGDKPQDSSGHAPAIAQALPDDGSAVCSLQSASAEPPSPSPAFAAVMRRVPADAHDAVYALASASPDPVTYAAECMAWLDGLRSPPITPAQLAGAAREFVADERDFDMKLFRGYLRSAARKPAPARSNGTGMRRDRSAPPSDTTKAIIAEMLATPGQIP